MEIKNISNDKDSFKKEYWKYMDWFSSYKNIIARRNKCFRNTTPCINKNKKDLVGLDIAAKELIKKAICNGAVYAPKPKMK